MGYPPLILRKQIAPIKGMVPIDDEGFLGGGLLS
jgi:hypothetical protein